MTYAAARSAAFVISADAGAALGALIVSVDEDGGGLHIACLEGFLGRLCVVLFGRCCEVVLLIALEG